MALTRKGYIVLQRDGLIGAVHAGCVYDRPCEAVAMAYGEAFVGISPVFIPVREPTPCRG